MRIHRFLITFFTVSVVFIVSCFASREAAPTRHKGTPQRIVSLAPSVTETLFTIGAGDRVVGVTEFCNWPPEVKNLPKVGQFARFNFERVLWLKPDLVVIAHNPPSEVIFQELDQFGIPPLVIGAWNMEETIRSVRDMGRAVGLEQEAEAVASEMERKLAMVKNAVKDAPKVKAVIVYGREPLILGGPGTFADDILSLAGGVNIAADATIKYPRYSIERLVLEGPDVIIEAGCIDEFGDGSASHISDFWNSWPSIPAVKNGRIVLISSDLLSRPGPRVTDGLIAVTRALHPDIELPVEKGTP